MKTIIHSCRGLLCLLVGLCLAMPPALAQSNPPTPLLAEDTFKNHEVWDIPWDTPLEKFAAMALEKTGLVFVSDEDGAEMVQSMSAQLKTPFELMGHPAYYIKATTFSEESLFQGLYFSFCEDWGAPPKDETLTAFVDLADRLCRQYGVSFQGFALLPGDAVGYVILREKDGQIDVDEMRRIIENEGEVCIYMELDNITLDYFYFAATPTQGAWEDLSLSYTYYSHQNELTPFLFEPSAVFYDGYEIYLKQQESTGEAPREE